MVEKGNVLRRLLGTPSCPGDLRGLRSRMMSRNSVALHCRDWQISDFSAAARSWA